MSGPLTYMRAERGAWCVDGLRDLINELPPGLVMAEIGVYAGEATREFMASGKVDALYAVDPWQPFAQADGWDSPWPWREVRATFEAWAQTQNVIVMPLASRVAEDLFRDGALEFVYIDACHDYAAVRADIDMWAPKVKAGGWIGGHDYSPAFPGVMRAVSEACARPMTFRDTSWLFRRGELRL